jgi:hypothetical protein
LKKPLALEKAWSGRNNTAAEEDRTKHERESVPAPKEKTSGNHRNQIQMNNTQKGSSSQNRFTRIWEAKRKPSRVQGLG